MTKQRIINPAGRRLSGVPGVPIVLADGQTWYLAAAVEKVRPEFEGDRFIGVTTFRGFPARADAPVRALLEALDEPDGASGRHVFEAASALLRSAHNLSPEEAVRLLTLPVEAVDDLVDALKRSINGQVPKDDLLAGSIQDIDDDYGDKDA